MTLEQILSDKTTFADNIELVIGNEKVTLGGLRELSAKQQKDLSDKIAGADAREREARETAVRAANLLSELEGAKQKLTAAKDNPPPPTDDFDKEEFWAPARKALSARDKKIDDAIAKIDTLSKSIERAATVWATDRWQSQYERNAPKLKKVDAYKDWDYDKVLEYATKNNLVDANGFPSIDRAVADLTKSSDLDAIRKQAYEDGLKKGRTEARLESVPRPSSASGGAPRGKGAKSSVAENGLEGLGDDVMDDPEIMEQIAALGQLQ